jgi:hypothetical protein
MTDRAPRRSPAGRDEKPVQLALDRRNYRISLDWRGQIKPRQVSRFALSLAAEKSSHHVLKLVLALADGNSLSSDPIDITYFTPGYRRRRLIIPMIRNESPRLSSGMCMASIIYRNRPFIEAVGGNDHVALLAASF